MRRLFPSHAGLFSPALALALPLPLALMLASACGGGVLRNPLGTPSDAGDGPSNDSGGERAEVGGNVNDAGTDGTDGTDGRDGGPPTLSGNWQPCGQLGTGGPGGVALSADGTIVAFLFAQGQIAVHRVADQALLAQIPNALGPVPEPDQPPSPSVQFWDFHHIALSPDGGLVVVADPGHLAAWRVTDGASLFESPGFYLGAAISPDGSKVLASTTGNGVELRALPGGALIHRYALSGIGALGFSADSTQALLYEPTCTGSCSVQAPRIRSFRADATAAAVSTTALDQSDPSAVVAFSPKGRYLATLTGTDAVNRISEMGLFRTSDGKRQLTVGNVIGTRPVFSPDETMMLVASEVDLGSPGDLIRLDTGELRTLPIVGWGPAALGAGGKPGFTVTRAGVYWSADPWGTTSLPFTSRYGRFPTLVGQGLSFMAAAASPDGRWLATSGIDSHNGSIFTTTEDVILWDLQARRGQIVTSAAPVFDLAFSPDSARLLVVHPHDSGGTALEEWPVDGRGAGATPIRSVETSVRGLRGCRYAPDGMRIAVSLTDGIGLLGAGDQDLVPTVAVGQAALGLAFSPLDPLLLATSGPALWRLDGLRRLWPANPPQPSDRPYSESWAAFSPDGKTILAAELDATGPPPWDQGGAGEFFGPTVTTTTRLYDAAGGNLLQDMGETLRRRPAFSPDGAWIVAGDIVWSVQSAGGRALTLSPSYVRRSLSLFTPDGTIAAARADGVIDLLCPK